MLELIAHALKRQTLLIDLPVDAAALRRRAAEDGEKARSLATDVPRLRYEPVDFHLLTRDHLFRSSNLVCARGIGVAPVHRG
ncbi:MAG TPA: hypothetical protein VFB29_11580 [Pseudolabrys sp.]|nr:hypothetical protein [Pseudolabrys sp.]